MTKPRFTGERIIAALKEAEAGAKVQEICRKYGISSVTFYNWRAAYGSLELFMARRLEQLEEENRRLRSIVADLTLSNQTLKGMVETKW